MTEIPMTALASSIYKSGAFEFRDQLTNLSKHAVLITASRLEIKR
jgi:hypothetical protein